MKIWIFTVLFSLPLFAGGEEILGTWISPAHKGKTVCMEVYQKEDGKYYGKILSLSEPIYLEGEHEGEEKMDLKNPDPSLQSRKLQGLEVLTGLDYEDGSYEGGRLYLTALGKTLYAKAKCKEGKLHVKGSFDSVGILGKTEVWSRIQE